MAIQSSVKMEIDKSGQQVLQTAQGAPQTPPDTNTVDNTMRAKWLDKLWQQLFDGDGGGLMSPGQIRREHRNRDHVRQAEMASILETESDLTSIHQGLKSLDEAGNVVDMPAVDLVPTHHIIERNVFESDIDIGRDSPASLLKSVVREVSIRDLERSLNLRKIAILAESEILNADLRAVSSKPIKAEWMLRWREAAEQAFSAELQSLWVRTLIDELAAPGSYSLGLISVIAQLSPEDLEMIGIVGKYAFPDFIYDASEYFDTDYHRNLLDIMEDLGLIIATSSMRTLSSQSAANFSYVLPCRSKALLITGNNAGRQLQLPVFKITRIGRQLFSLFTVNVDLAYLYDLARHIKQQRFEVSLGDWSRNSKYVKKVSL